MAADEIKDRKLKGNNSPRGDSPTTSRELKADNTIMKLLKSLNQGRTPKNIDPDLIKLIESGILRDPDDSSIVRQLQRRRNY